MQLAAGKSIFQARRTFWLMQCLGVFAAAVAATIDIESILGSGPLLVLSSAVFTIIAFRASAIFALSLALATPSMAVLCFAIIVSQRWGPQMAHGPIAGLIWIYAIFHGLMVPLAVLESDMIHPPRRANTYQFSIRFLLEVTLLVAFIAGSLRFNSPVAFALAVVVAWGYIVIRVVRAFYARSNEIEDGAGHPLLHSEPAAVHHVH